MPSPLRVARRTVILLPVVAVAACEDTPGSAPTSSRSPSTPQTTRDAAEVAALRTVAAQIQQVSAQYAAVVRRHPALGPRLAQAIGNRREHLLRLKAFSAVAPAAKAAKPVPAEPEAALAGMASREQALAVAHSTGAVKLSGQAARLIAMIAASETQLALTLGRRP